MVIVPILAFLLVAVVGYYVASQRRESISPVFRPALRGWRVLRLLALVLIAWGLFISGRAALQLIAVAIALFAGVYIAVEQPIRTGDDG